MHVHVARDRFGHAHELPAVPLDDVGVTFPRRRIPVTAHFTSKDTHILVGVNEAHHNAFGVHVCVESLFKPGTKGSGCGVNVARCVEVETRVMMCPLIEVARRAHEQVQHVHHLARGVSRRGREQNHFAVRFSFDFLDQRFVQQRLICPDGSQDVLYFVENEYRVAQWSVVPFLVDVCVRVALRVRVSPNAGTVIFSVVEVSSSTLSTEILQAATLLANSLAHVCRVQGGGEHPVALGKVRGLFGLSHPRVGEAEAERALHGLAALGFRQVAEPLHLGPPRDKRDLAEQLHTLR